MAWGGPLQGGGNLPRLLRLGFLWSLVGRLRNFVQGISGKGGSGFGKRHQKD